MGMRHRKWLLVVSLLLPGLGAAVMMLLAMAEVREEIAEPFWSFLDVQIQSLVHRITFPGMTSAMLGLTWMGSPAVLVPCVSGAIAVLWLRRKRDAAVVLLIAAVGAGALNLALKLHFRTLRPDVPWAMVQERSFSFPSGHSMMAVVLYGTLLYLWLRGTREQAHRVAAVIAAVLLIVGIGYSRVYLGAHYPSDVGAGYLAGCMWLATVVGVDWVVRWAEPGL